MEGDRGCEKNGSQARPGADSRGVVVRSHIHFLWSFDSSNSAFHFHVSCVCFQIASPSAFSAYPFLVLTFFFFFFLFFLLHFLHGFYLPPCFRDHFVSLDSLAGIVSLFTRRPTHRPETIKTGSLADDKETFKLQLGHRHLTLHRLARCFVRGE